MKRVLGTYKIFLHTLVPKNYEGFAECKAKNTFHYFSTMIFNALAIMFILMLPALFMLPSAIESRISKDIDTFRLDYKIITKNPIMMPEKNPLLLINYQNKTPIERAKVIINNDVLYAGLPFTKYTKDLSIYRDVKQQANAVSNFAAFLFLLMLPALLLIFYFYMLIKFFIIAFIASVLAMIIAAIMKYRVRYKHMLNCALYGISLTVLIDVIFFAFGLDFYYIQYLPLIIYIISGIMYSGDKIDSRMKGKYLEIRG